MLSLFGAISLAVKGSFASLVLFFLFVALKVMPFSFGWVIGLLFGIGAFGMAWESLRDLGRVVLRRTTLKDIGHQVLHNPPEILAYFWVGLLAYGVYAGFAFVEGWWKIPYLLCIVSSFVALLVAGQCAGDKRDSKCVVSYGLGCIHFPILIHLVFSAEPWFRKEFSNGTDIMVGLGLSLVSTIVAMVYVDKR